MADESKPPPQPDINEDELKEAVEKADDPGGAHSKGWSADPPADQPSGPPPIPVKPEPQQRP